MPDILYKRTIKTEVNVIFLQGGLASSLVDSVGIELS